MCGLEEAFQAGRMSNVLQNKPSLYAAFIKTSKHLDVHFLKTQEFTGPDILQILGYLLTLFISIFMISQLEKTWFMCFNCFEALS